MSYNIKHGEGQDGVLDLSRAAAIIKDQNPNLIALQEIDRFCRRSDSMDQTEYLVQQTSTEGSFGKFMDYDGGAYGMATLSAKPIISTKVLELPDALYEPRSAIIQEIQISENASIVFVNVHFDWVEGEEGQKSRLNQAKELVTCLDQFDQAIIITGDFNCTSQSSTMQYFFKQGFEFAEKGEDRFSFQGEEKAEIDHLIYKKTKNQQIDIKSVRLLDEPIASDHRPLVVELEIVY